MSVVEGEAAGEGKGGHDAVISGETGATARGYGLPGYLIDATIMMMVMMMMMMMTSECAKKA